MTLWDAHVDFHQNQGLTWVTHISYQKLGVTWDVHIDYLVGNLVNALTLQNYMI